MAEVINPPTYYFDGIQFNPAFYENTITGGTGGGSGGLTEAEANALYLQKTVPDTATALQTFDVGIKTDSTEFITNTMNIGTNITAGTMNIGTNLDFASYINIGSTATNTAISRIFGVRFEPRVPTEPLFVGETTTTSYIKIGTQQTSAGYITLGSASSTVNVGNNLDVVTQVTCDKYKAKNTNTTAELFNNVNIGTINIGQGLFTGYGSTINIGNPLTPSIPLYLNGTVKANTIDAANSYDVLNIGQNIRAGDIYLGTLIGGGSGTRSVNIGPGPTGAALNLGTTLLNGTINMGTGFNSAGVMNVGGTQGTINIGTSLTTSTLLLGNTGIRTKNQGILEVSSIRTPTTTGAMTICTDLTTGGTIDIGSTNGTINLLASTSGGVNVPTSGGISTNAVNVAYLTSALTNVARLNQLQTFTGANTFNTNSVTFNRPLTVGYTTAPTANQIGQTIDGTIDGTFQTGSFQLATMSIPSGGVWSVTANIQFAVSGGTLIQPQMTTTFGTINMVVTPLIGVAGGFYVCSGTMVCQSASSQTAGVYLFFTGTSVNLGSGQFRAVRIA